MLAKNSTYGALATIFSLLTSLVSLPLAVRYLGAEKYGFWIAVNSWIVLSIFADFGLSNAMVTSLSAVIQTGRWSDARRILATCFLVTAAGALVAFLISVALLFSFDVRRFFNASAGISNVECVVTIFIVIAMIWAQQPINLLARVFYARQEAYIASVWQVVGGIAGVLLLLLSVFLDEGLVGFAVATLISRLVATGGAAINALLRYSDLRFTFNDFDKQTLGTMSMEGGWQLLATAAYLIQMQVPYLIGPHVIGLEALGRLGLMHRIFGLPGNIIASLLAPLWPAYVSAITGGKLDWAWATFKSTFRLSMVAAFLVGLVLVLLCVPIYSMVTGSVMHFDYELAWLFLIWLVIQNYQQCYSLLIQGLGGVKLMSLYTVVAASVSCLAAYCLGQIGGPSGVLIGWMTGCGLINCTAMNLHLTQLKIRVRSSEISPNLSKNVGAN